MKNRIIGFDLARAYAIFGMFVVNFNTVFGSHTNHNGMSGFLNLFNGNSSTLFVILAGMGISLMTNRSDYTLEEKKSLKKIIHIRSWFLFVVGLLFYLWWPADILHFYGGYMHIALLLIFLPKRFYLLGCFFAILIFHILLFVIPYDTGWNFTTFQYSDFWTVSGFSRNTFYNGWNSIFPWIAYFFLGMYLGRLDWQNKTTLTRTFTVGFIAYISILLVQTYADNISTNKDLVFYLSADYLPPFLPFMLGTASFGLILISLFMFIGSKVSNAKLTQFFVAAGQMTLTHYIVHIFLGFYVLSLITGKKLSYEILNETPSNPMLIFIFAVFYFICSCIFSYLWKQKFKNGPLETIMRKISG